MVQARDEMGLDQCGDSRKKAAVFWRQSLADLVGPRMHRGAVASASLRGLCDTHTLKGSFLHVSPCWGLHERCQ